MVENDTLLSATVMRKIGANETGNYILEGTIEEVVDSADIVLFEGTNYLYTNYLNIEIMVMFSKIQMRIKCNCQVLFSMLKRKKTNCFQWMIYILKMHLLS